MAVAAFLVVDVADAADVASDAIADASLPLLQH
jgi:hypothetical protein